MTVALQGHVCHVIAYPISIEWPPRWLPLMPDVRLSRRTVRARFGIAEHVALGLGVERWDFTKGVIERFLALELLLEQNSRLRGQVSLLQIAAPSRSKLPAYQALQKSTLEEVERINARFATVDWKPIVLLNKHQNPQQVFELYRAADFCIVNSLHDGMNLVAKEFVSARDDEDGVLILSTFAGASRELLEALLVNPFDVAETAAAIRQRARHAARATRAAHAAHAADGQGEQRLPLGRTLAYGRSAYSPAAGAAQSGGRAVPGTAARAVTAPSVT